MQILLDYRPALRQRTGVGEYIHETAKALVATAPAHERLVLFSSSWKDRLPPAVVPGADVVDRRVPVRLLNLAWHRLGWPPVEALCHRRFDVVQATSPLQVPSRSGARLVTVYDLDFLDHPEQTRAEIRRDYPALAARHAKLADHVVVISDYTSLEVQRRFGVAPSRISTCIPGAPNWPKREAEPPATEAILLFIGTIEPRKNLDALLDAYGQLIARLPNAPKLVLAGRQTSASAGLSARSGEPPFAGRVELPGYVDETAKRGLFRRALVCILPSAVEGFGIPALEAMATGVPVIAANHGALPEAVGSAGRLVDGATAEGLAAALFDVVTDEILRERMRQAGWARVRAFTWTRTAQQMREGWQRAIEHRAGRRG